MKEKKKKSVAGTVCDIACIVICVLLVPVLVVNTVLIVKGLLHKDRVPDILGWSPLVVETDSMKPVFAGGDLILVRSCDTEALQVGDIISFYEPTVPDHSVVVTHRITGILSVEGGHRSFRTKGDANNTQDSVSVLDTEVVGTYRTKAEGLGLFVKFLTTTKGMLLLVVLPLALIFGADYAVRAFTDRRRKKAESAALPPEI